jgi:hypothetical protein
MVSMAGSQMQEWMLNWQLYELTGSAVALGLLGLVRVLPMVALSLAGGAVADALDRRRMMLAALAAIRVPAVAGPRGRVDLQALTEGVRLLQGQPLLFATMLLDFLATFFASANALLPIFAKDILHVGPKGYGVLAAAPAVGSRRMAS